MKHKITIVILKMRLGVLDNRFRSDVREFRILNRRCCQNGVYILVVSDDNRVDRETCSVRERNTIVVCNRQFRTIKDYRTVFSGFVDFSVWISAVLKIVLRKSKNELFIVPTRLHLGKHIIMISIVLILLKILNKDIKRKCKTH